MNIIATAVKIIRTKASPLKASLAKRSAPSWFSRRFEYMGTKAALNAPSAKNRRNILGNRNATIKASSTGPTPISAYSKTSRAIPKMRLIKVQKPTVMMFRKNFKTDLLWPSRRRSLSHRAAFSQGCVVCFGCKISTRTCL